MRVPIVGAGQGLVQALIKVLVVGEDDMATNVEKLLSSHPLAAAAAFASAPGLNNLRSLPGSRRWTRDHRGSRWRRRSTTRGHPACHEPSPVIGGRIRHTIWFRRFAAPRPVGPAPMTSTSTLLGHRISHPCALLEALNGDRLHVGVRHPALQKILNARHLLQCLASDVQHKKAGELVRGESFV